MNVKLTLIVAAVVGTLAAPLAVSAEASAEHFIKDSIEGNLAEVKVGELAQQNGASQGVKDFGVTLAKDHAAANAKAKKVAQSLGVAPPSEPGLKQKAMYQELSALSAEQFDRHFIDGMVKDHQEDIAKYEKEAKSDSGPAADYAKQTLPTLQKHLQIAQRLQEKSQKTASASENSRPR